jgi:5-methyltetrahydropteroyltriglutamate--homocysteine methyltransferase
MQSLEYDFLTQEIGSIQRPIWRQKLNAPANREWIEDALRWGEEFGVEERRELADGSGGGLLEKDGEERTEAEKSRIIDIATIYVIRMLEKAGLDRVFNGEQPRTEMYDTLARLATGMETAGLVNSFDANYFRKGIVAGDLAVLEEGVRWFADEYRFVEDHTDRIVKPCLTGPYTMTDWSYVEHYRSLRETRGEAPRDAVSGSRRDATLAFAEQVLNPIVREYVRAGATVIQIDEPAASTNEQEARLVVESVNAAFAGVPDHIEKAVHLCYSNYVALFPALAGCVADSYQMECTNHGASREFAVDGPVNRKAAEAIRLFRKHGLEVSIGAGVIDVHSDLVEAPETVKDRLLLLCEMIGDPRRVQVNPDCGLRTRRWEVAYPKLVNMVAGARLAKEEMGL